MSEANKAFEAMRRMQDEPLNEAEVIDCWETIRTSLTRLSELEPIIQEWQPIETSPESNGSTVFLAYIVGHGPCVCYKWNGTIKNASKSVKAKSIVNATHWMPLPSPPTALRR